MKFLSELNYDILLGASLAFVFSATIAYFAVNNFFHDPNIYQEKYSVQKVVDDRVIVYNTTPTVIENPPIIP